MSRHTQGPWIACHSGRCQCGLVWAVAADAPIVTVLRRNEEEDVDYPADAVQANARLVAAAPAMHDLLERLLAEGSLSVGDQAEIAVLLGGLDAQAASP